MGSLISICEDIFKLRKIKKDEVKEDDIKALIITIIIVIIIFLLLWFVPATNKLLRQAFPIFG